MHNILGPLCNDTASTLLCPKNNFLFPPKPDPNLAVLFERTLKFGIFPTGWQNLSPILSLDFSWFKLSPNIFEKACHLLKPNFHFYGYKLK